MSFSIVFKRQECSPISTIGKQEDTKSPDPSKEIFLKCICPEGTSNAFQKELKERKIEIPSDIIEEASLDKMGSKVRSFLEDWDTKGLSPIHIQAERRLLKNFLCSPRDNSAGVNNFSFFRKDSNFKYSVHIIGSDLSKVEECLQEAFLDSEDRSVKQALLNNNDEVMGSAVKLFEKALEEQRSILKQHNLPVKDGAVLTAENTFQTVMSNGKKEENQFSFDARKTFTSFCESYQGQMQFLMIDPKAIYYFSFAPTISKIEQVLNYGGIGIRQKLEELKITK